MAFVFLGLLLIMTLLHIFWHRYQVLTKCLLMPLVVAFYLALTDQPATMVIVALVFALSGDYFMTRPQDPLFFQIGMLAFMLGHVTYAVNMMISANWFAAVPIWFWSAALVYIALAAGLFKMLQHTLGQFKIQFLIYCAAICLMSLTAGARFFNHTPESALLTFAGSLIFIVSDGALALCHFKYTAKNCDALIMSTYVAAQVLIVTGLAI